MSVPREEQDRRLLLAPAAEYADPWKWAADLATFLIMRVHTDKVSPETTIKVHEFSAMDDVPGFVRILAAAVPEMPVPAILAAVSEGFCPAHKAPLDGGSGAWVPWCSRCEMSWCCGTPPLSPDPSREGFTVSRIFYGTQGHVAVVGELRVGTRNDG